MCASYDGCNERIFRMFKTLHNVPTSDVSLISMAHILARKNAACVVGGTLSVHMSTCVPMDDKKSMTLSVGMRCRRDASMILRRT